jgi:integrase
MSFDDRDNVARPVRRTGGDGILGEKEVPNKMSRRTEVRVRSLLDLVQRDYIDNHRKSKATLDVHIDNHLAPFFAERSAERLRPSDIEAYKSQRKSEGAKNSTINLELAALRRAFSLGTEREIVVNHPKIKLYNVGKSNRRTGFFEHDEFERQVAALLPYAKQVLKFGYECGWRQGEIFGLHWTDDKTGRGYYDEGGQVISLYDSKSGHGRVFPLRSSDGELNRAGLVIEEQKTHRVKDCPLIFHFNGKPISRSTFNKHWHAASQVSGVTHHFHDLRRTVVRNLTRAGVHRTIAKAVTGHESDNIFERYDIVDTKDITEAITKMSDYVKKRNGSGNGDGNTNNTDCINHVPDADRVENPPEKPATAGKSEVEPENTPKKRPDSIASQLHNSIKSLLKLFGL